VVAFAHAQERRRQDQAVTTTPRTTDERPDLEECVARGRRGRDMEALYEAARRYGADIAAELAAVEAGTHPLQERRARR
jgi:hypothetical protein